MMDVKHTSKKCVSRGRLSNKELTRRYKKKVRQLAIAKARDSLEKKERLYEQPNIIYVKSRSRLERSEDRFSDRNIYLSQWENVPLHGPHAPSVIPTKWNGSSMQAKNKPVKRVSWADEKKKKFIRYIAPRPPYNCHLATRSCFMTMKCQCMNDDHVQPTPPVIYRQNVPVQTKPSEKNVKRKSIVIKDPNTGKILTFKKTRRTKSERRVSGAGAAYVLVSAQ